MMLGEKIFKLRKKCGLSQEQLGEKINVTRQTISNWELGETSPNPEQLKLLSKVLNISIDDLLDNDIQSVLVEKVNSTEKTTGLILKVLKWVGIIFIVFLIIDVVSFILYSYVHYEGNNTIQEVELQCSIDENNYIITVGSDGFFSCSNCSKKIQRELKDNHIDFEDIPKTLNNIENYFKNNNGLCE